MKSKWISVFLTLFMVLSLFAVPLQIWADGDGVEEQGEAAQEENLNSWDGTTDGDTTDGGTTEDGTAGSDTTEGGPADGDTTDGGAADGGAAGGSPADGIENMLGSPALNKPLENPKGYSPYMGKQFIPEELQKKIKVKFWTAVRIQTHDGRKLSMAEYLDQNPVKYTLYASNYSTGEDLKIYPLNYQPGFYHNNLKHPLYDNLETEAGPLTNDSGNQVVLPAFTEDGYGIKYDWQPEKDDLASPCWMAISGTDDKSWVIEGSPNAKEHIFAHYRYTRYYELVNSEIRTKWLTSTPVANRPTIELLVDTYFPSDWDNFNWDDPQNWNLVKDDIDPSDPDYIGPLVVPLLKTEDDFIRLREDGGFLKNFTPYTVKDVDITGLLPEDLLGDLTLTFKDIDNKGYVEKDGKRFKATVNYDWKTGGHATLQEEYPVTFNAGEGKFGDGTTEFKTHVLHGETIQNVPANPEREGYTFKGWKSEQGDSFNPSTPITKALNFTAMWEEIKKEYTITYKANGGTFADGQTEKSTKEKAGDKINLMEAPTRDGYKFLYWEEEKYQPGQEYTVTEDHTFTAAWEEIKKEYTITYIANGGTFSDGKKIKVSKHPENEVITIIDAPTWAGHTFQYWEGSRHNPGDTYTVVGDHTFKAIWDKPEDPNKPKPDDEDKPVPYNPYKPSISITPQSGFVMGQPRLYSGAKPQMPPKPITQLPATGSANPAFVILLSLGLATLGLFLRKRS